MRGIMGMGKMMIRIPDGNGKIQENRVRVAGGRVVPKWKSEGRGKGWLRQRKMCIDVSGLEMRRDIGVSSMVTPVVSQRSKCSHNGNLGNKPHSCSAFKNIQKTNMNMAFANLHGILQKRSELGAYRAWSQSFERIETSKLKRQVNYLPLTSCCSSSQPLRSTSNDKKLKNENVLKVFGSFALILLSAYCGLHFLVGTNSGHFLPETVRSVIKHQQEMHFEMFRGLGASFALIFLSEIGDKTFFIAALLALSYNKAAVFIGSMIALAGMSATSVAIGSAIMTMPGALSSPFIRRCGEVAAAGILLLFGFKNLYRYRPNSKEAEDSIMDEEMKDAMKTIQESKDDDEGISRTNVPTIEMKMILKHVFKAMSLIFLAECGDRSMLATVALATSYSPMGVMFGATAGHAVATGLAVIGGAIMGKYINEKMVTISSGILFIIFGCATVLRVF